jgi:hypothetical protein
VARSETGRANEGQACRRGGARKHEQNLAQSASRLHPPFGTQEQLHGREANW